MPEKKIVSVGFEWPGNLIECVPLDSNRTLLDGDIIIFMPDISLENYIVKYLHYNTPVLDRDSSESFLEYRSHWIAELIEALNSGKTIFVFLVESQGIYLDRFEQKEFFTNYDLIPHKIKNIANKTIKEIRIREDSRSFSKYWDLFRPYSEGKILIDDPIIEPIFTTKGGEKTVGGYYSEGKGNTFFLPPLLNLKSQLESEIANNEFLRATGLSNDQVGISDIDVELWNIGRKLAQCLIEIDKSIKEYKRRTPPPDWTLTNGYRIKNEIVLEKGIAGVKEDIDKLQKELKHLERKLEEEATIRALLYESGTPLEEAIIEALRILGFKADNYKDDLSQFDSVFTGSEGRFLGEAEGKDNKAIAIKKLRQLRTNLDEDFDKESVHEYAKGVLFGNAYRLRAFPERGDFFTEKCTTSAKERKIALVRTPDLFFVVRYLKENDDPEFARKCREAIKKAEGEVVEFPPVPKQS